MIGIVSYHVGGGRISEDSERNMAASEGRNRHLEMLMTLEPAGLVVQTRPKSPSFELNRSCLLLGMRELKFSRSRRENTSR